MSPSAEGGGPHEAARGQHRLVGRGEGEVEEEGLVPSRPGVQVAHGLAQEVVERILEVEIGAHRAVAEEGREVLGRLERGEAGDLAVADVDVGREVERSGNDK